MKKLLTEISHCTICKKHLPFVPRPVLQAGRKAKIIIIGQAPGLKVQQSGKPWDDASGKKLPTYFLTGGMGCVLCLIIRVKATLGKPLH